MAVGLEEVSEGEGGEGGRTGLWEEGEGGRGRSAVRSGNRGTLFVLRGLLRDSGKESEVYVVVDSAAREPPTDMFRTQAEKRRARARSRT